MSPSAKAWGPVGETMMVYGVFLPNEALSIIGAQCTAPSPLKMTRQGVQCAGKKGPCPEAEEGAVGTPPGMRASPARCHSPHGDNWHVHLPHGTTAPKTQQESGPGGERGYPRGPDKPRGSPCHDRTMPEQGAHHTPDRHHKCLCGI